MPIRTCVVTFSDGSVRGREWKRMSWYWRFLLMIILVRQLNSRESGLSTERSRGNVNRYETRDGYAASPFLGMVDLRNWFELWRPRLPASHFYFILYLLYDDLVTVLQYVTIIDNVNTFPFWRAISKSSRSANRVLYHNRGSTDSLSKARIPKTHWRRTDLRLQYPTRIPARQF